MEALDGIDLDSWGKKAPREETAGDTVTGASGNMAGNMPAGTSNKQDTVQRVKKPRKGQDAGTSGSMSGNMHRSRQVDITITGDELWSVMEKSSYKITGEAALKKYLHRNKRKRCKAVLDAASLAYIARACNELIKKKGGSP